MHFGDTIGVLEGLSPTTFGENVYYKIAFWAIQMAKISPRGPTMVGRGECSHRAPKNVIHQNQSGNTIGGI